MPPSYSYNRVSPGYFASPAPSRAIEEFFDANLLATAEEKAAHWLGATGQDKPEALKDYLQSLDAVYENAKAKKFSATSPTMRNAELASTIEKVKRSSPVEIAKTSSEAMPETLKSGQRLQAQVAHVVGPLEQKGALKRIEAAARAVEEVAPVTMRSVAPAKTTTAKITIPVLTKMSPLSRGLRVAGKVAGPVVALASVAQTADIARTAYAQAKQAATKTGAVARGVTEGAGHLAEATNLSMYAVTAIEDRYFAESRPLSGARDTAAAAMGVIGDAIEDKKLGERGVYSLAGDLEKGRYGSAFQSLARIGENQSAWTSDIVGDIAFVLSGGDVSGSDE